jgi:hypothetical protein
MPGFEQFKWLAETAAKIYLTIKGNRSEEWDRLGRLFDKIAGVLDDIAEKFLGKAIPREEFIAIQVFARELASVCSMSFNHAEEDKEQLTKMRELLDEMIVQVEEAEDLVWCITTVPGPVFSRKAGVPIKTASTTDIIPTVYQLKEAAAAFRATADVIRIQRGTIRGEA